MCELAVHFDKEVCVFIISTALFLLQYIERNNITDLGRDMFSFNTKVNVGDFYEARVSGGENVSMIH